MEDTVGRMALDAALQIHAKHIDLMSVFLGAGVVAVTVMLLGAVGGIAYARVHGHLDDISRRTWVRGLLLSFGFAMFLGGMQCIFLSEVTRTAEAIRQVVEVTGYEGPALYVPPTRLWLIFLSMFVECAIFLLLIWFVLHATKGSPQSPRSQDSATGQD